jgi:hypothetical protein
MAEDFRDGEPDSALPPEAQQLGSPPNDAQPAEPPLELLPADSSAPADSAATEQVTPPEISQLAEPLPFRFPTAIRTFFVAVAAWIVPGSGHLLQGRFVRALAAFATVAVMTVIGLRMHGNVFPPHADDAFGVLGFIADVSSGMFYFLAHTIEKLPPNVSHASGDYGTRLVATAGVLNLLFVLDAMEISRGRKG